MFLKLVVLILVLGSSGVGLLSVRQSRLQAVHEMAEARHRIRRLNEQAGEVRTLISQSCTPDRVHAMLPETGAYRPAIHNPARIELARQTVEAAVDSPVIADPDPVPPAKFQSQNTAENAAQNTVVDTGEPGEYIWVDPQGKSHHIWVLEDGSRVVFVND